ncbi:MAG: DUF882 domain-containing protein [Bdellovibrionales bacterium]|nr:DUF882 domain-containing protein [Bdellovibrionales bacterium]
MTKSIFTFIIAVSFLLTACGSNKNSTSSSVQTDNPSEPKSPPTDGDGSDNKNALKVCFSETSEGTTCFKTFDLNDVNNAEKKYAYMDSFNDPKFPKGLDKWQYRSPINLLFHPEHPTTAKLSENFMRYELMDANSTRGHYGLFSPLALERIQQLRNYFGKTMIINSGYRSPAYNASLSGAAQFSRHTFGDAIDFKIPGVSFSTIAKKCLDMGAAYYQIYQAHVHCDWRTQPLNETIFGKDLRPTFHQQSFNDITKVLSQNIVIIASKTSSISPFSLRSNIRLSAEFIEQEDAGELMYEWDIVSNGKTIATSNKEQPLFQLKKGAYQIFVKIGGSLSQQSTLTVQ